MVDALPSFLFLHAPDFAADHYYCDCAVFVLPGMKVLYNQVVNVIWAFSMLVLRSGIIPVGVFRAPSAFPKRRVCLMLYSFSRRSYMADL